MEQLQEAQVMQILFIKCTALLNILHLVLQQAYALLNLAKEEMYQLYLPMLQVLCQNLTLMFLIPVQP